MTVPGSQQQRRGFGIGLRTVPGAAGTTKSSRREHHVAVSRLNSDRKQTTNAVGWSIASARRVLRAWVLPGVDG
jgi:hypothetical protein